MKAKWKMGASSVPAIAFRIFATDLHLLVNALSTYILLNDLIDSVQKLFDDNASVPFLSPQQFTSAKITDNIRDY